MASVLQARVKEMERRNRAAEQEAEGEDIDTSRVLIAIIPLLSKALGRLAILWLLRSLCKRYIGHK